MLTDEEKAAGLREPEPPEPKPEWRWKCPKCKARIGESCVYLQTSQKWHTVWETGLDGRTKRPRTVQTILHREGDPTTRSHNERTVLRYRKEKPAALVVKSMTPAVAAYWEADRLEYRQMREWLRANSWILWRTDVGNDE